MVNVVDLSVSTVEDIIDNIFGHGLCAYVPRVHYARFFHASSTVEKVQVRSEIQCIVCPNFSHVHH